MRVYIDERGNNSLGAIQQPENSTLLWGNERSLCTSSEWTIHDPKSQTVYFNPHFALRRILMDASHHRYEGWLLFDIGRLFKEFGEARVGFLYGWSGYSVCPLFVANEGFIKSNRLEHFLSYWKVK
eukprot:TRINITY_DN14364_c0_g1_i1.p1 TRINITY_DN14364_c0_g1~~TRINITY_DN14364_c0_g1_i1.p1  ORF type:complete len:126 (-),score=26.22 TRINITY_DN14364_c0_g1_i1:52-429(-)